MEVGEVQPKTQREKSVSACLASRTMYVPGCVPSVFNTVVEKLVNGEKQARDLTGAGCPPSPQPAVHRHLLWRPQRLSLGRLQGLDLQKWPSVSALIRFCFFPRTSEVFPQSCTLSGLPRPHLMGIP